MLHTVRRTRWPRALLLVVLLALLIPAASAGAQGMLGLLPEPITSDDLDHYADRLGLSDEQLLAISSMHAQYLTEYRRFREREVDDFLEHLRTNAPRRFEPDVFAIIRDAIEETKRLMRRVRQIDDGFFTRMQSVLTQDQSGEMSRVRMQRERARLATESSQAVAYVNPAVLIDLTEMADGLHLSPEQEARVDPILEMYERRLTSAATGLYDLGMEKAIDVIDVFEALELTEESFRDPRQLAALLQTAQNIWQEHVREFLEEAAKIAEMQRRTFRQLVDVLPRDEARLLRRAYFRQAYPEAAHIGSRAERTFAAALALQDLNVEVYRTIDALAQSHIQRQDRRAERIADLLDELRFELTLEQAVQQDRDPRRQRIAEIRDEAEDADEQAIESLHALLGDEQAAKLANADRADDAHDRIEAIIAGRAGRAVARSGRPGQIRSRAAGRHFNGSLQLLSSDNLPSGLAHRDISQYRQSLALDETGWLLLQSLYEEYAESFEAVQNSEFETLDERVRSLTSAARDGDDVDDAAIEQVAKNYREAFDAIRSLDESFFDGIALAVLDDDSNQRHATLERLRMQRERDRYAAADAVASGQSLNRWNVQHRSEENRIDLARLVRDLHGAPYDDEAISALLNDYERELTTLMRERFEKVVALSEAMTRMNVAMQHNRVSGTGSDQRGRWRSLGRAVRSAGEEASQTGQRIATLNRTTLDSLAGALLQEQVDELRLLYDREAFSFVYEDDSSADPVLSAALELTGLSDGQLSRLRDLAMQYRAEYTNLSQQIVEVYRASAARSDESPGRQRLNRAEMNTVERLDFERMELNRRTERQILAILSPEQLDRLEQIRDYRSAR